MLGWRRVREMGRGKDMPLVSGSYVECQGLTLDPVDFLRYHNEKVFRAE
jgi:hypothetical protein